MKPIQLMSALLILTIAPLFSYPSSVGAEEAIVNSPPQLGEASQMTSEMWRAKLQAEQTRVVEEHQAQANGESGSPFLKMFEGLGYCLVVFLVGVHLYKRFHKHIVKGSQSSLKLIETLNLPTKAQLFLIEVEGQKLLVSSGSQAMGFCKLSQSSFEGYEEFKIPSFNVLEEHQANEEPRERVC